MPPNSPSPSASEPFAVTFIEEFFFFQIQEFVSAGVEELSN